ncbi:MAG: hypothetical protein HPY67_02660 [Syntrophaceae bacterium]|nr:hypothetical protein [Syntrophaceae bacterium]
MKRRRRHSLTLAAITAALAVGVAILYVDFYDNGDLVCLQQLSSVDNEEALNILRKNPRMPVAADAIVPSSGSILSEATPFPSPGPAASAQRRSILRC